MRYSNKVNIKGDEIMAEHFFHLKANWPGDRNDIGEIQMKNLQTQISIPPEMDGPGIGTNPDEMLLGAAATCYIITLAAMMERSNISKESLYMDSTAIVDVTNGVFTYKKIVHRPTIVLRNEKDMATMEKIAIKAEQTCMISKALRGNVEIALESTILLANE